MDKDKRFDFNTNWYEIWMKQSKEFFESAEKNLKDVFERSGVSNPEDQFKKMQDWQGMLKKQWQFLQLDEQQKAFENYWKAMMKMSMEASDMMVEQWKKRMNTDHPVKDVRELYDLWLNCCHEIYQKGIQSKSYQEAYGEFMNAAIKFWKSALPK